MAACGDIALAHALAPQLLLPLLLLSPLNSRRRQVAEYEIRWHQRSWELMKLRYPGHRGVASGWQYRGQAPEHGEASTSQHASCSGKWEYTDAPDAQPMTTLQTCCMHVASRTQGAVMCGAWLQ